MDFSKTISNIDLKKEILKLTKYAKDYKIRAEVYSSYDIEDKFVTDLDLVLYIGEEHHTFGIIENKTEEDILILKKEGNKLLKYLKSHFENVDKDILVYNQ